MSLDCGKSRVELRGASPALPETGCTVEQCELYRLSALWNPETCRDTVELETELSNLCALHPLQPMLQLLQCNIGLCIYCRARALGRVMSRQSLDPIVDIARRSLDTERTRPGLVSVVAYSKHGLPDCVYPAYNNPIPY